MGKKIYKTLQTKSCDNYLIITIMRAAHKNSISLELLTELNQALDVAERDPHCKFVILEGDDEYFCSGMDFEDIITFKEDVIRKWTSSYMSTLKRFTESPQIIVTKIIGKTIAGGVGIAAASDIVIANNKASFKLSETLWGLLPAMVSPFLIRRVGFQKAYTMMLMANTIDAKEAEQIHLIDILNQDLHKVIEELSFRFSRIESKTVKSGKTLFHKMWIINEDLEKTAIEQTTHLLLQSEIQKKIHAFLKKSG